MPDRALLWEDSLLSLRSHECSATSHRCPVTRACMSTVPALHLHGCTARWLQYFVTKHSSRCAGVWRVMLLKRGPDATLNQGAAAARRMTARRLALGCQLSEGYTLSLLCGGTSHMGNSASRGMLLASRAAPPGASVTISKGPLCLSLHMHGCQLNKVHTLSPWLDLVRQALWQERHAPGQPRCAARRLNHDH